MSALCLGRPLLHQPLSATVAQTVLCRFEKAELVSAFFAERHNIHLRKAKMRIVSTMITGTIQKRTLLNMC
jgi:hypothetical protein